MYPTKGLVLKQIVSNKINDIASIIVSDNKFNQRLHKKILGYYPNLDFPQTFSEKLLYLKEHYRNKLQQMCSDKYLVNKYLEECGCEEIKRPIIAVYEHVKDVNLDELPERFFVRCNHMSGFNYVYDKNNPDCKNVWKMLNVCMHHSWYVNQREWNYKGIKPLIICEKLLIDEEGEMPLDYKFYCFSGEPKYFMVSKGEYEHNVRNHKFDMEGNSIDHFFKKEASLPLSEVEQPANYYQMVNYVKKLCKPFPHVRVDLYSVGGKIYFGELTFYSNGGVVSVYDSSFDKTIGSWIDLSKYSEDMI